MSLMRVSAKADYGLRALIELARAAADSRPLTCEEIAAAQDVPQRFLKAVIAQLRRADLVRSQRGCEGGYWLARAAGLITVGDVVRAVDGPFPAMHGETQPAPTGRRGPDDHRVQDTVATLDELWRLAAASLERVVNEVTLADLAGGRLPQPLAHLDATSAAVTAVTAGVTP
jgi:Rrf2 family protein